MRLSGTLTSTTSLRQGYALGPDFRLSFKPVSYTHLDVYKRQHHGSHWNGSHRSHKVNLDHTAINDDKDTDIQLSLIHIFLGSLFIWVLSLVMILTVYSRFFKLYMASAIAPIPLASFAGQPSSSIGVAFIKSYAAICLEGCMIVLACIIFSQFAAAPPAIADDTMAAATIVWNYIGELIFNMLVLVGAIKMSDRLVRELMGLG